MIDFPASPIINQIFNAAGLSWTWDGAKWAPNGVGIPYLSLAGGTLIGTLALFADPTLNLGAATKQYADAVPTKWTLIQTQPAVSVSRVIFTNIPQIYGDLMITGNTVANQAAGTSMALSAVNSGSVSTPINVSQSNSANSTFVILLHGYTNDIGFMLVNYNTGLAFAASPNLSPYSPGFGVTTHAGGCNSLQFAVIGGTGAFTSASGSISVYGR